MNRGFTLVEVIVALFITMIASVLFFEIISTTLGGIYNTQKRGEQIYSAQGAINDKIADQYQTSQSTITFTFAPTLTTSSKSTSITIYGTMITDASKIFYVFVPALPAQ